MERTRSTEAVGAFCAFQRVTAKEGGGSLLLCTSPSALRGGFFPPRGGGLEKNKTLKAMPLSIPDRVSANLAAALLRTSNGKRFF